MKKLDKLEALAWRSALAGTALAKSGGFKLSIPFYTCAIEIYRSVNDDHMRFHALNDRAIAYSDLGRYKNAITDFKSCMGIADKYDDRVMRLQTLLNWGETTRRKGSTRESISKLKRLSYFHASWSTERLKPNPWPIWESHYLMRSDLKKLNLHSVWLEI